MTQATRRWRRHPQPSLRGARFTLGVIWLAIGIPVGYVTTTAATGGERVFNAVCCGAFVLAGLLLVYSGWRRGQREARILSHGRVCLGLVEDARRTGIEFGDVPLFVLTVGMDDDGVQRTVQVREVLPPEDVTAAVGAVVRLRVSEDDPDEVRIEAVEG